MRVIFKVRITMEMKASEVTPLPYALMIQAMQQWIMGHQTPLKQIQTVCTFRRLKRIAQS